MKEDTGKARMIGVRVKVYRSSDETKGRYLGPRH